MEPHLLGNLEYWKKRLESEVSNNSLPSSNSPPQDSQKVTNRYVARLKQASLTRHKSVASTEMLAAAADSPIGKNKRPLLRRSNSDVSSPIPPRKRNPSPLTTGAQNKNDEEVHS